MSYDALNRLKELIMPLDVAGNRSAIVPQYNRAGALAKVSCGGTEYVENIVYDAKGQRLLIAFGNGMMTRYAYDPQTFRLLRQRSEKYTKTTVGSTVTYAYNSGTNKQDDGFNFDLIGNIMTIMNRVTDCGINGSLLGSDALDRHFTYDPVYRLLTADGRESDTQSGNNYLYDDAPAPGSPNANHVRGYDRTYSYDKLGNIQDVVQSGINGFTRGYTYHANKNTLEKIEDATPAIIESYTYDANGNQLTAGSSRNYVWNHADQLVCYYNQAGVSDPTVYTQYDYAGQDRVSKLVRTGTAASPVYERTIYIDGIFEYVILETSTTTYEKNYIHIMDDQSRIAELRVNAGAAFPGDIADDVVYNLEDQIGSSSVRLDLNGTVIDKEEYYPFGDSSLRTFTYKRYRYVGKERDAESGLYYYGARYYAAWTCRFISVDPLAAKYAQLTPYNYADNNPINDFDIDGMQDGNTATTPSKGASPGTVTTPDGPGTVIKETLKEGKRANLDNTVKEIAKDGAGSAAKSGGGQIAKQTAKSSKFKPGWGLLKGLFLGIIEGLFSSPPIDNISQFQTAYHLAEKLEFKDDHANKNMLFWASRIDWKNADPEKFKDVYLYRAMETQNGNWIMSDLKGAPNSKQLGAKTPFSNNKAPDVYPDSEGDVAPDFIYPHGLSTGFFPNTKNIQDALGRMKQGDVGKISIKEILTKCLIPSLDPKDLSHVLIQPVTKMSFTTYQTLLNSLPWRKSK